MESRFRCRAPLASLVRSTMKARFCASLSPMRVLLNGTSAILFWSRRLCGVGLSARPLAEAYMNRRTFIVIALISVAAAQFQSFDFLFVIRDFKPMLDGIQFIIDIERAARL